MRRQIVWAVAAPALIGAAALVALLPWGDPCTFATRPGEGMCSVLFTPPQQYLRNAVFLALCLLIGCAAGLMSFPRRYLAGALSTPLAVLLAVLSARVVYGLNWPLLHTDVQGTYRVTVAAITGLIALGLIGGALSRHIRLTIVGGSRDTR